VLDFRNCQVSAVLWYPAGGFDQLVTCILMIG
jgi:hypothetical protein